MGTPEGNELILDKPKAVFIEELTPAQKAKLYKEKVGDSLPVGLFNLGNTCYMNSTLQVLKKMKELVNELFKYNGATNSTYISEALVANLKKLYKDMESTSNPIKPIMFIESIHLAFPQFAQVDNEGYPMQQDTEEFWTLLLTELERNLNPEIAKLYNIDFEEELQNTELESEPPKKTIVTLKKLSCNLTLEQNQINYLSEAIKFSLEGTIEKQSELLGRNAIYKKTSKIKTLPPYLTVQFVRFFWKEASSIAATKSTKTKVLRAVNFPKVLDLYDLCTNETKEILDIGKKEEYNLIEEETKKIIEQKPKIVDQEEDKKDKTSSKDKAINAITDEQLKVPIGTGKVTGKYQLIGVVSHKGRSADSGHYVGWTHSHGNNWDEYDDEIVKSVSLENILDLKGGGDWHIAYLLLYRRLEVANSEKK